MRTTGYEGCDRERLRSLALELAEEIAESEGQSVDLQTATDLANVTIEIAKRDAREDAKHR